MAAPLTVERARKCAAIVAAAVAVRCGSPTQPREQPAPTVVSIAPANGPMGGGTSVQISGSNFEAGAQVTIGGAAATDVVVASPNSITAKTPPRSSTGAADVTVTVAGKTGTLPGGFSYQVDPGPPVIDGMTAQGSRPNEPAGFADVGEEIAVIAKISDPDTPIDQLQFQWTADVGTVNGTGANVAWRAPADARTPLPVTISLTVSDNVGSASSSTTISLHNSIKEVGDLARDFLLDFSDSTKPTDFVLRNFSSSARCSKSRGSEFDDVVKNRTFYRIEKSSVGEAKVNVQFNSVPCTFRANVPINGDACAVVPVSWDSLCLVTNPECNAGDRPHVEGLDHVTEVYEDSRWRLCGSAFASRSPIQFKR